MNMDQGWVNHKGIIDRRKPEYLAGVNEFLEFAFDGKEDGTEMRCPCANCNLSLFHNRSTIHNHLVVRGIIRSYSPWIHHGECDDQNNSSDEDIEEGSLNNIDIFVAHDVMSPLVRDGTNLINSNSGNPEYVVDNAENEWGPNEVPNEFYELMKDAEAELYPDCKTFARLEFIVTLLHVKISCKWSDKSLSMLLKALERAFNNDENSPESSYDAKKYTRALGLDYVKIDACINHCIYRKQYEVLDECLNVIPLGGKERNNLKFDDDFDTNGEDNTKLEKVPRLILRHFPLVPRLQRMFMSSKLAKHMRWRKEKRLDVGKMRHPAVMDIQPVHHQPRPRRPPTWLH